MKSYELQKWIDEIDKTEMGRLISTDTEGKKRNIPLDPANSDYAEYLRYTAWVEAGNTPEDFWTQDDELIEPREPKEEETTEQPSSTPTKLETDLGE